MDSMLQRALDEMAQMLGNPHTAGDVGPHLTCPEADAVAAVLTAGGHPEAAETWLAGHATEDDEGDMHYEQAAGGRAG